MTGLNTTDFNADFYLRLHSDVQAAVNNPNIQITATDHYNVNGVREGRISNRAWDENAYLAAYPDVALQINNGSIASGLEHFSIWGLDEGRRGHYDIDFDSSLNSQGFFINGFDSFLSGNNLTLLWGNSLNDALSGNESGNHLRGSGGDDILYGHSGDDVLFGHHDNDVLYGGSGQDILFGDESTSQSDDGNDELHGESGNDHLTGGGGLDTLFGGVGLDTLLGGNDKDKLYGGDGDDILYGNHEKDTLYGDDGDDILYGNEGRDTLHGDAGNDILYGNESKDKIYGNDGNDTLYGNEKDDRLFGGSGDDLLEGGSGKDFLGGGWGNDTYIFRAGDSWDTISDGGSTTGDAIFFDSSISFEDVTFERVLGEAHIDVITSGVGDRVRIMNQLNSPNSNVASVRGIETFNFNDEVILTAESVLDILS